MQGMKCGAAAAGGGGESPIVKLFSETLGENTYAVTIDLSGVDLSQYIELKLVLAAATLTSGGFLYVVMNNDTASHYYDSYGNAKTQLSIGDINGHSSARAIAANLEMRDGGTCVLTINRGTTMASSTAGGYLDSQGVWSGGGFAALNSIKLYTSTGYMKAGSKIALYGLKG